MRSGRMRYRVVEYKYTKYEDNPIFEDSWEIRNVFPISFKDLGQAKTFLKSVVKDFPDAIIVGERERRIQQIVHDPHGDREFDEYYFMLEDGRLKFKFSIYNGVFYPCGIG